MVNSKVWIQTEVAEFLADIAQQGIVLDPVLLNNSIVNIEINETLITFEDDTKLERVRNF